MLVLRKDSKSGLQVCLKCVETDEESLIVSEAEATLGSREVMGVPSLTRTCCRQVAPAAMRRAGGQTLVPLPAGARLRNTFLPA